MFLFLSPLLGSRQVEAGWLILAMGRATVLAAWQFLLAPAQNTASKDRAAGVGTALLYGLPFWCSSLFFSLRPGQFESVLQSLGLYGSLVGLGFVLGFLKTHWLPTYLGALAFWCFGGLGEPFFKVPLLLGLIPLFWPRKTAAWPMEKDDLRLLILLAGGGFSFSLYLGHSADLLGLRLLARALTCWLLLTVVAGHLLGKARKEREERCAAREAELALPSLESGLVWSYRKTLLEAWSPWLFFLVLSLWTTEAALLALACVVAQPGLWSMSSKGRVGEVAFLWWSCGQFLILWGIVESQGMVKWTWIPVALLVSGVLGMVREAPQFESGLAFCTKQGKLELALASGLKLSAPPELKSNVLKGHWEPSVDLDEKLASEAPSGFRQRLLARLKHTPSTTDDED